jgi:uncharacterized membrane protein
MTNYKYDACSICLIVGTYVTWTLLIFGALVSGLSHLGFPAPSPWLEKSATYLMAFSLLIFALSYFMLRASHSFARR